MEGLRRGHAAIVCAGAALLLSGCEPIRSMGVRRENAAKAARYEEAVGGDVDSSDTEDPTSIFKPTRRLGGLSEEAREIERSTFHLQ